jgi:hypothetical protein
MDAKLLAGRARYDIIVPSVRRSGNKFPCAERLPEC